MINYLHQFNPIFAPSRYEVVTTIERVILIVSLRQNNGRTKVNTALLFYIRASTCSEMR